MWNIYKIFMYLLILLTWLHNSAAKTQNQPFSSLAFLWTFHPGISVYRLVSSYRAEIDQH